MLHTGTMFAVIVYFWNAWLDHYCSDASRLWESIKNIAAATIITLVVGLALKLIIEKIFMHGQAKAEVEELFSYLPLIGGALLAAGLLIIYSGSSGEKRPGTSGIDMMSALVIGAVQGLCLPFRGFSRSGGTISAGLLLGIERRRIEEFSFVLAVVLTPFADGWELLRLIKAHPEITHGPALVKLLTPGLLGMVCSFTAGYLALKLLSRLLEAGRWKYFGYYCLVAAAVVFGLAYASTTNSSAAATNAAPIPVMDSTAPAPAPAPATNAVPVSPAAPATNAEAAPATTNQPVFNTQVLYTNSAPANVPAPQN
jgi:undecaprenyl-diphosphatase